MYFYVPQVEFFDIPNGGGGKTLKARMFKPPGLKEEEEGTKYPMVLHV